MKVNVAEENHHLGQRGVELEPKLMIIGID